MSCLTCNMMIFREGWYQLLEIIKIHFFWARRKKESSSERQKSNKKNMTKNAKIIEKETAMWCPLVNWVDMNSVIFTDGAINVRNHFCFSRIGIGISAGLLATFGRFSCWPGLRDVHGFTLTCPRCLLNIFFVFIRWFGVGSDNLQGNN